MPDQEPRRPTRGTRPNDDAASFGPGLPRVSRKDGRDIEYLNLRRKLTEGLRPGRIYSVDFIKRTTGGRRRMRFAVPIPDRFRGMFPRTWDPRRYNLLNVLDHDKNEPRMINLDSVLRVRGDGMEYRRWRGSGTDIPRARRRYAQDADEKYYPRGYGPDDTPKPMITELRGDEGVRRFDRWLRGGGGTYRVGGGSPPSIKDFMDEARNVVHFDGGSMRKSSRRRRDTSPRARSIMGAVYDRARRMTEKLLEEPFINWDVLFGGTGLTVSPEQAKEAQTILMPNRELRDVRDMEPEKLSNILRSRRGLSGMASAQKQYAKWLRPSDRKMTAERADEIVRQVESPEEREARRRFAAQSQNMQSFGLDSAPRPIYERREPLKRTLSPSPQRPISPPPSPPMRSPSPSPSPSPSSIPPVRGGAPARDDENLSYLTGREAEGIRNRYPVAKVRRAGGYPRYDDTAGRYADSPMLHMHEERRRIARGGQLELLPLSTRINPSNPRDYRESILARATQGNGEAGRAADMITDLWSRNMRDWDAVSGGGYGMTRSGEIVPLRQRGIIERLGRRIMGMSGGRYVIDRSRAVPPSLRGRYDPIVRHGRRRNVLIDRQVADMLRRRDAQRFSLRSDDPTDTLTTFSRLNPFEDIIYDTGKSIASGIRSAIRSVDPRETYRQLRGKGYGRVGSGIVAGGASLLDSTVLPGPLATMAARRLPHRRRVR